MSEFSVEKVHIFDELTKYEQFVFNEDKSVIIITITRHDPSAHLHLKNIYVYDSEKDETKCCYNNVTHLERNCNIWESWDSWCSNVPLGTLICSENKNEHDFYLIDISTKQCVNYKFDSTLCCMLRSAMSDNKVKGNHIVVSYIKSKNLYIFSDLQGRPYPLSIYNQISDRPNSVSRVLNFYENRYIKMYNKIYDLHTNNMIYQSHNPNALYSSYQNGMMMIIDGKTLYKFAKREPKKGKECIVCFSEINKDNKKVLASPCGHALFCKCVISNRLTTCPVCRVQVQSFIPVFDD